ncbi:hypothetical protein [Streptacidiphilus sp. MAP5-3]|uniref:hypothetical protein n=1 Tax=unclassified Streptacidiphilus TaxID=2643834 RepID=UPI0035119AFD
MPERVYMNRRPGEECIHIEITPAEIPALLFGNEPETGAFMSLLVEAGAQFEKDRKARGD